MTESRTIVQPRPRPPRAPRPQSAPEASTRADPNGNSVCTAKGNFRGRGGFSLLEMLVAVIIMGLMVALVAPRVLRYVSGGKVTTTKSQIAAIAAAVERFHLDVGRFPTVEEGLEALVVRPQAVEQTVWDGPYLEKDYVPHDGWDREFQYLFDANQRFVVRSLGADGRPGGEGENADLDNRST